ncbi:hypothetical protein [Nitrospira calida]
MIQFDCQTPILNGREPAGGPDARPGRNGHGAGCPKCRGLVLARIDLHLGWEPYCVNCGWTPLTSLEAHRAPEAETRVLAALRRLGRVLAQAGGPAPR